MYTEEYEFCTQKQTAWVQILAPLFIRHVLGRVIFLFVSLFVIFKMGLSISNGLLYILKELKLKWYLEHSKSQWTLLIIIIIIIIIITTIILSTINAWK